MTKQLLTILLAAPMVLAAPLPAAAQVFNTGPAGLARQMPRIYGPHMANRARLKYLEKRKRALRPSRRRVPTHRTSRARQAKPRKR